MNMTRTIDFYFDFSSPYGYFASTRVDTIAGNHGATVRWRPILLGLVFPHTGGQPLATIPLKGEYGLRDIARCARLHGIAFRLPAPFPISSQAPARAFYFASDHAPERATPLAQALFKAYMVEGRDISNPDVTADVAQEVGLDRATLRGAVGDPALKQRVRSETDAALARGVFGSPFVIVGDEPFWGFDRLEQVERWLATGGW
jgi:2-hydroxychromene-2-carboxylate isomerase